MIPMTVSEIAKIVGGSYEGDGSALITREPFFDSRKPIPGGIFLALKGENVDGHDYVSAAVAAGAITALTTRPVGEKCIVVADVLEAISKLGAEIRNRLPELTVIGITGSQGKTTTKDIARHVLSMAGETIAPEQSFNNDLGVPLTLLRATEKTQFCILEMGARHMGDIAALAKIAAPNVGAVLKVGTAHLGEFGSRSKIAQTKAELIHGLSEGGIAVLGSYDEFTPAMAAGLNRIVITFGESADCKVRAADLEIRGGFPHFDLVTPEGREPVSLRLLGAHQTANALAAAAIAYSLGVSTLHIASALSSHEPTSRWRMELHELGGIVLINDCYNANPESMTAALRTLALLSQEHGGRSWAFLSTMHELGDESASLHHEVGALAHELKIDHLVAIANRDLLLGSARSETHEHYCSDSKEAALLIDRFESGDVILVKASRAEHLEELAAKIVERMGDKQ